jgi:hypothetical protein
MWFASFFVAAYVGWWVHERLIGVEAFEVASGAGLLPHFEPSSPSVSGAVVGTLETSTLAPPVKNDLPFEEEMEQASVRPQEGEFAGLTKAELYRRAREEGIKGRSTMSKDQLAAALRARIG